MDGLGSLLLFAALLYFMMRVGCGAHMVHGHGGYWLPFRRRLTDRLRRGHQAVERPP